MRILAWTISYWNTPEEALKIGEGILGLRAWKARVQHAFSPVGFFVACGTWSDPSLCPTDMLVVNSGVEFRGPLDYWYRNYSKCAIDAGLAYALNRTDWDILLLLDNDGLLGDCDCDWMIKTFWSRPETLMAPSWHGGVPGGPMLTFKRAGAARLKHFRRTPNMRDAADIPGPNFETELADLFRNLWYNPWPDNPIMMDCDPNHILWNCPMTGHQLTAEFAKQYLDRNGNKVKPLQP